MFNDLNFWAVALLLLAIVFINLIWLSQKAQDEDEEAPVPFQPGTDPLTAVDYEDLERDGRQSFGRLSFSTMLACYRQDKLELEERAQEE